jgi:hypothetical protein
MNSAVTSKRKQARSMCQKPQVRSQQAPQRSSVLTKAGMSNSNFVGGLFCPLMHAFEAWHPLHVSDVCALCTDSLTSMTADIAACGAYLAVGQLLRRSGLIQDSDTQARRHAHAAFNPLGMRIHHPRSAEPSHGGLKYVSIVGAGCSRSGAVCHAAVPRTPGAAADASGSGDRGQGDWLWCCRLPGGCRCQLVSCQTSVLPQPGSRCAWAVWITERSCPLLAQADLQAAQAPGKGSPARVHHRQHCTGSTVGFLTSGAGRRRPPMRAAAQYSQQHRRSGSLALCLPLECYT